MDLHGLEQRLAMLEENAQRQREIDERRHEEMRTAFQQLLQHAQGPDLRSPEPPVTQTPDSGDRSDPLPHPNLSPSEQGSGRVKAALPADYDGQRKGGQTFLNSCQLYIQLVGARFADDQQKIHWALTFCKSGRAANFADRVLKSERSSGVPRFANWAAFVSDFQVRFCESNEQVRALTKLEGDSWYQRTSAVDDYIDSFEELVDLAGLTPDAGLVMKFRRGLNKELQDRVAEMENPPGLSDLEAWKRAARRFYENVEANRAFTRQARPTTSLPHKGVLPVRSLPFQRPLPNPLPPPITPNFFPRSDLRPPGLFKPKSDGTVPMEVDSSKQRQALPGNCFRCHQPGHIARDCPLRFDIRAMTQDERKDWLEQMLAEADTAHIGAAEVVEEVSSEIGPDHEQGFPTSSE